METEEYIKGRLDDQLSWYSKKSRSNQKWFKGLRLIEITSAALIPFFSGMNASPYLISGLGVLITVIAAVTALFKYQEHWIEYRTIAEQLKHEKYLYLTRVQPYDSEDNFQQLVGRVESLISKENSSWASTERKRVDSQKKHDK